MPNRNVSARTAGIKATEQVVWPELNGVAYQRITEPKVSDFVKGRTIIEIWKNRSILMMKFADGDTVEIGWADTNGNPVDGEPVMIRKGRHVFAKTASMGAKGHPAG